MNWSRFISLARFHRIQGLVWNALAPFATSIPKHAAQELSSDARSIAATNLAIARECTELKKAFAIRDAALLFVKGLTVAALAYRSPMLKMAWDIDVLIDPLDLGSAADTLIARGFILRLPSTPANLQSWHSRSKESVWSRPDGLHVELHTALADSSTLISALDVNSNSQEVEILPGHSLPTLAKDELFTYLCVHGASSAWFRLKWITDLAALLHQQTPVELERLYRCSLEMGAYRASAQALLLADNLYDSLEGTCLRKELEQKWINRALALLAVSQVLNRDAVDPTSQFLGTWRIHLNQLSIGGGLIFAFQDICRQIASRSHQRRR